ncbi:MAG: dTMP kinase [Propionibacteriaceae bacterium]|nr:dTMP kinase [Propionibacteriaceae bacterium]
MTGPGLFVVFEGGDGAGKSTHAGLLADWLRGRGLTVCRTFEPGDTALGREIRRLVLDPASGDIAPRAEALLYAADKAHHVHAVVRPALARGEIVVCDRYVDSMVAYQGAGRVLAPDEVAQVARWGTDGLRPDLTILLDVDVAVALGEKEDHDRLEQAGTDFHERVREFYLQLAAADPGRYLVVDSRRPKEAVAETIQERVAALL